MRRTSRIALTAMLVLAGCGGGSSDGDSPDGPDSTTCDVPDDLVRIDTVPIGVLMPAGSLERQSYTSGADVAAAGLTAVSLGFEFYYTAAGEIVFDFDGNADDAAKRRWKDTLRCTVLEAKEAGLVVAVWGQFIEAGRRGEPGEVPAELRRRILDEALILIPEVATLLEELQVEYWAPVSELDRFAGVDGHNEYFPSMVQAGRPLFTGIIYAQPNILQRDGFAALGVTPDLGGVDALGISWISYECEPGRLPPGQSMETTDFFLDAAAAQGIDRVFISEIGGTQAADESARPCLERMIDAWGGASSGVFILDMPSDQPGGATIKGNWQESVLQTLLP